MIMPDAPIRKPRNWTAELRVGLVFAGLMLLTPWAAKLAARQGWAGATDFAQRALMVLIATFIVVTGNTIPKRIATLACRNVDASRLQAFYRLAGWTWVLTGLALGLAWLVLPQDAAGTATLIVVPAGMAVIAFRWLVLRATGRPTP